MQPHLKNDLLYLLHILEAAEKITLYASGYDDPAKYFDVNDGKEFNASLMLLVLIGEQAAKVSSELKEKYTGIDWKGLKSFRNRSVHDYTGLDKFVTFDIIHQHIPLLKSDISVVIEAELDKGNFDKEEFYIAQTSPYLTHVNFDAIRIK